MRKIALILALLASACSGRDFSVEVALSQTGGLKPGDNVVIRGLRIGQVKHLDLEGDVVVAKLALERRYGETLDEEAKFTVVPEKLVTGKVMLQVERGQGAPLQSGARVMGQVEPLDVMGRAQGMLDQGLQAFDTKVDQGLTALDSQLKTLKQSALRPDELPPRTVGDTIDLDRPRHFVLHIYDAELYPTKASGHSWDGWGAGTADPVLQAWVGSRQILLTPKQRNTLKPHFDVLTEPFELSTAPIKIKILDADVSMNDEVGIVEFTPTPLDANGRIFRLAAGRIKELRVALEWAPSDVPGSVNGRPNTMDGEEVRDEPAFQD